MYMHILAEIEKVSFQKLVCLLTFTIVNSETETDFYTHITLELEHFFYH